MTALCHEPSLLFGKASWVSSRVVDGHTKGRDLRVPSRCCWQPADQKPSQKVQEKQNPYCMHCNLTGHSNKDSRPFEMPSIMSVPILDPSLLFSRQGCPRGLYRFNNGGNIETELDWLNPTVRERQ